MGSSSSSSSLSLIGKNKATINIKNFLSCYFSVLLLLLLISILPTRVLSVVECQTDDECETKLRKGSKCNIDSVCTNPFEQGCLRNMMGTDKYNLRVCNSLDENDSDNCITDFHNYTEIRIHTGNWESSIFYAYILQIVLMEILQVPAVTPFEANFYDPINSNLQYSDVTFPLAALENAKQDPTCSHSTNCIHIVPEVWNENYEELSNSVRQSIIDPPVGNGEVGKASWFIPRFTAQQDESLVSFFGLQGEEHRHKLAEKFPRPLTWNEYCELAMNCTEMNHVAKRYPITDQEKSSYYHEGLYHGKFIYTNENNCTMNPNTCTGHFIAPVCTTYSNVESQAFWNNIVGFDTSNTYTRIQADQLWRAANYTQSNVILAWVYPDARLEEFYNTSAEFQPVLLPGPTEQCVQARPTKRDRCSGDPIKQRGPTKLGSCDFEPHELQKVIVTSLRDADRNSIKSLLDQSPAHDFLSAFQISDLDMNVILKDWITNKVDLNGYDARLAVCSWVSTYLDDVIQQFIPIGFPRQVIEGKLIPSLFVAQGVGGFVVLLVVVASILTYKRQQTQVFIYAQVSFVFVILFGLFLVGVCAIVTAMKPSPLSCGFSFWLLTLGYTLELVPLLVKIAAINDAVSDSTKFNQRIHISPRTMYKRTILVFGTVFLFLMVCTIIDPPSRVQLEMLNESTGQITLVTDCASNTAWWLFTSYCWVFALLLWASVLAVQSRDVEQAFNESRALAVLAYSHFLFIVLQIIINVLNYNDILGPQVTGATLSFLLSADTLLATIIYILPKLLAANASPADYKRKASLFNSYQLSRKHIVTGTYTGGTHN